MDTCYSEQYGHQFCGTRGLLKLMDQHSEVFTNLYGLDGKQADNEDLGGQLFNLGGHLRTI